MRCITALFIASIMFAEVVDRLAITVGGTVITELQIDEDMRVAALLNGQPVSRDADSRRSAADRLVEQLLIQHEIEMSRYPAPSQDEVTTLYTGVEQTMGGADRLKDQLAKYSVSQQTLRAHLMAQLSTLRFIEFRFRPDVTISDNEIEAAYQRQVSALQAANSTAHMPPLDAAQKAKLTQVLMGERTDAALTSWLAESRKQVNIKYIDTSLQ